MIAIPIVGAAMIGVGVIVGVAGMIVYFWLEGEI